MQEAKIPKALSSEASRLERAFVFALCLLGLAWAALDAGLWQRGWQAIDENESLRLAWLLPERGFDVVSFASGTWHRLAMAFFMRLPTPLGPWLPSLLAFALEMVLLYQIGRRLGRERWGLGAALFVAVSAFKIAGARSLLAWSFTGLEICIVALLLLDADKKSRAFWAGLLGALFALDYEAWAFGLTGLLAWRWLDARHEEGGDQTRWRWIFLGLGLGGIIVIALSWQNLSSWWDLRKAFTLSTGSNTRAWGQGLWDLWRGGKTLPALGCTDYPALSFWSRPILIVGTIAALYMRRGLLLWALIGLAPMTIPNEGLVGAQRAIAAWPALALICGFGLATVYEAAPRWRWLFPLALAGAMAMELIGFNDSQKLESPEHYALARAKIKAAAWLSSQEPSNTLGLLTHLDHERAAELEWLLRAKMNDSVYTQLYVLLPWSMATAVPKDAGPIYTFDDGQALAQIYLWQPQGEWKKTAVQINAENLALIDQRHPWSQQLLAQKTWGQLETIHSSHLWARTALWQRYMTSASMLNMIEPKAWDLLFSEPMAHAGPFNYPAHYLARHDPAKAALLLQRAWALDPRLNPKNVKK